jgi:gamma-glutamyl hercynylcysteine S-oxide synthase
MRVHRNVVVALPDRDDERAGVIMTICMNEKLVPRPTSGASEPELAAQLRATRTRTTRLTEDLSAAQLMGPMLPIVNPILWEMGHVGWFHEYWTLRQAHGQEPLLPRADRLWNSSTVAHDTRWELDDLPDREGVLRYLHEVLERELDRLGGKVDLPARYFYELAIRHEDMHVEALAYTRQTLGYGRPQGLGLPPLHNTGAWPGDADIPGGMWRLGSTSHDGFIFDNEKWAHEVTLAPFRIAKAPVTNAEFAAFVEDDGYQRQECWTLEGWDWRERADAQRPVYWLPKEGERRFWRNHDKIEPLAPYAPVTFVNWHEAQAWCRWAKRRLPTEAEWETAALGRPTPSGSVLADGKRSWPWGEEPPGGDHANLDFAFAGPIDVSACAAGDSGFGCRQMIGNAWEWTASDFAPFPGFAADPYEDYSQPWFNSRKVLRGGSFATSARIARASYRNFFTPERNDVIASFRTCAL